MAVVIRALAFANGVPCPIAGQYLMAFDFEAHDGRGFGEFTRDTAKAMQFASEVAAWEFWKRQSTTRPTRPDGRPNRPLTATTITTERLP
jgi:hypothetical protein